MPSRWEAIKQMIFGSPKQPVPFVKETKVAVLGAVEQNYGIYVIPSFRDMVTTFWNDPLIVEAVRMFAEQVVATGTYLTSNPLYTLKLDGKTALDIIRQWCDDNNLDIKLVDIAIELKAFGNSFWRLDKNLGFVKIPVESVWHAVRIEPDIPLQEKYNLQLVPIYGAIVIPYGEFIHFRVNVTGYKAPFGMGTMYHLLAKPQDSKGIVYPSMYDIRLAQRGSLHEGFRKFSFGNELWVFEGMSNEYFENSAIGEKIANMSSTGNRIATNVRGDIKLAVPERTQSYDMFIKMMSDEFMMSLADPSLKLGLEKGFTKATSETAKSVYKYKITTMRNTIKQHLEDLFKQILDTLGYDGIQAEVKLNFGPEEIAEYNIADILATVDRNIITPDEARHLLSRYHKWDITGKAPEEAELEVEPKIDKDNKQQSISSIPLRVGTSVQKKEAMYPQGTPIAPQTIVEMVELPEGIAGYNKDFSKVYIDMLVQHKTVELGLEYSKVEKLILAHETFEYQALLSGRSWDESHKLATRYEKTVASDIGLDWKLYEKLYLSLLPIIKNRKSIGPLDLIFQGKGIINDRIL